MLLEVWPTAYTGTSRKHPPEPPGMPSAAGGHREQPGSRLEATGSNLGATSEASGSRLGATSEATGGDRGTCQVFPRRLPGASPGGFRWYTVGQCGGYREAAWSDQQSW